MSEYIIKTMKIEEGKYKHEVFDENGNSIAPETILENNKPLSDYLYYYTVSIVPFMRTVKTDSLETKVEIMKK
ncbi:MAG TPA: hypothetical protein PK357_02655 [Candidatus Pacearchaeota archaeon]|nr:hypothetical protein [Candidatus Pacearchaeota archaeon]